MSSFMVLGIVACGNDDPATSEKVATDIDSNNGQSESLDSATATATDIDSNNGQSESLDSAMGAGETGGSGVGSNSTGKMPSPTLGESSDAKKADSQGRAKEKLPAQRSGLAGRQSASDSQIGGTCGTMFGQPVVAGASTSCGFAMEVAMLATAGTHPEAYWPVTATSRETGKTYTMSCGIAGTADRVWCKDMNGGTAEVTVGPGEDGSWSHLIDY
ncbi:hypothetical protein [Corynebacterium sp. H113]|uniref:hypothetical protein n=1 Tax=Corynebacterium sp. H113 TaxID=3133419 RepID=UPI003095FFCA